MNAPVIAAAALGALGMWAISSGVVSINLGTRTAATTTNVVIREPGRSYTTVDDIISSIGTERSSPELIDIRNPAPRQRPVVKYGKPERLPNGGTRVPFVASDFGDNSQRYCDAFSPGEKGVGMIGRGRDRWAVCINKD